MLLKNDSEQKNILEDEIDIIVYKVYELSYNEVKVIDPEIESRISEVEFNAFNID